MDMVHSGIDGCCNGIDIWLSGTDVRLNGTDLRVNGSGGLMKEEERQGVRVGIRV